MRLLLAFVAATAGLGATERIPVLLELFTSQGCSSCPPADRLLAAFDQKQPVDGVELIVLSEHVDYWNHLGWRDPFSSPLFSARQNGYAARFRLPSPYTPQLVVDGQHQLVGSDSPGALAAIGRAQQSPKSQITLTSLRREGDRVSVHLAIPSGGRKATVFLALAEAGAQSQVARGENAGRSLSHVAVVRSLAPVAQLAAGQAFAQEVSLALKPGTGTRGFRVVAFVEEAGTGRIVATGQTRL